MKAGATEAQLEARARQRLEGLAHQQAKEQRRRIGQLPATPMAVVEHHSQLVQLHNLVEQFGAPCVGKLHIWGSEDRQVQRIAAAMCTACPVIDECGAYAEAAGEPGGVWGGKVWPTSNRRKT